MRKLYFPHDNNARNDTKLLRLRSEFGWEGYAWFFAIVEMIFEANGKLDVSHIPSIALSLNIDGKTLERFLQECYNIGLFKFENNTISNDRIDSHLAVIEAKSRGGKASGQNRKSKNSNGSESIIEDSSKTLEGLLPQRREEKIRENDINSRFAPPSVDEVVPYFISRGSDTYQANQFHNYYSSNGWKVGKSAMKDWQAAARNWIGRNRAEQQTEAPKPQKPEVVWVTVAELNREQQEKFLELCGGKWKNDVVYQGKKYCFRF